jgi:4'-phosphopantetheinyl transferase
VRSMQIFAFCIQDQLPASLRDSMFRVMDADKQQQVLRLRHREDQDRGMAAHCLIKFVLHYVYGLPREALLLTRNEWGKPYIADSTLQFNLTHSGNWVVCGIDSKPIGVDIEQINNIDTAALEPFFSPSERHMLEQLEGRDRGLLFYDLWTLKESYVKMIGKGLSIPLHSFSVEAAGGGFRLTSADSADSACRFRQYPLDESYKLSVCAQHDGFPEEISRVSTEVLEYWSKQW